MGQTKFTPAPWVVSIEDEDETTEIAMSSYLSTPWSYYSCHKVLIEANDKEALANAHLIASAPEMYNMLQDLLNAEGVITTSNNRKEVKALLAKARGKKC